MSMLMRVVLLVLLIVGLLSGCSNEYHNVNVGEANQMIQENNVEIIDVRTKEEYDSGHVPNSRLLPLQEIDKWYGSLDKNKTYLIVCRSGNRSGQASDYLVSKGYKNIYNMTGGMNQWTYGIEK